MAVAIAIWQTSSILLQGKFLTIVNKPGQFYFQQNLQEVFLNMSFEKLLPISH